jgi:hypothetical protein
MAGEASYAVPGEWHIGRCTQYTCCCATGLGLHVKPPDHHTVSLTAYRCSQAMHQATYWIAGKLQMHSKVSATRSVNDQQVYSVILLYCRVP